MKARDIEQTVSDVIHTVVPKEQKVRYSNSSWYTMKIAPYRTADHVVRGAILEFVMAFAEGKEGEPRDLRGLGGALLAMLPHALALLDSKMCITWGNLAFLHLFEVAEDIFGRPFEDLWGGRVDQPDVWKLIEDAAIERRPLGLDRKAVRRASQSFDEVLGVATAP